MYAFEFSAMCTLVLAIFGARTFAKIHATIVQGVMVCMISDFLMRAIKKYAMHGKEGPILPVMAACVEGFSARIPSREPIPLGKRLEIGRIDNGILALGKSNQFAGGVLGLNYRMTFNAKVPRHLGDCITFGG